MSSLPRSIPRVALLSVVALALATVAVPATAGAPVRRAAAPEEAGPGLISHHGRWLTDSSGRVRLMTGVNIVAKGAETPDGRGFGDDDAQFLADQGFDVVRLGLSPDAFMPTPGKVDAAYLASFAKTARTLTSHGLLVLVDLHQDGWGPATSGNGFPAWMTDTRGAENTHTGFPLYYITNPAIQAAFDSFWDNEQGPDGIGFQDQVATMFTALSGAVGDDPNVIGYDILNEPWPGTTWQPCLDGPNGCPDLDASGLDELHDKVTTAIRTEDSDHLVFGEPYVLFNFGQAPTNIRTPGDDPRSGMSFHMYTTDPALEPVVLDNAIDWSKRTGGALLATEFGATNDPVVMDRMVRLMENKTIPWIWWSYDENVVHDLKKAPTGANINEPVLDVLVRPHPVAVAGTPTAQDYDVAAHVLRFSWSATSPDGTRLAAEATTLVKVPSSDFPGGYEAKVVGGTITSAPGASEVTITNDPGVDAVSIKLWPKGEPEPADEVPTAPVTPPGTPVPPTVPSPTVPGTPVPVAPPAGVVAGRADFTG